MWQREKTSGTGRTRWKPKKVYRPQLLQQIPARLECLISEQVSGKLRGVSSFEKRNYERSSFQAQGQITSNKPESRRLSPPLHKMSFRFPLHWKDGLRVRVISSGDTFQYTKKSRVFLAISDGSNEMWQEQKKETDYGKAKISHRYHCGSMICKLRAKSNDLVQRFFPRNLGPYRIVRIQ